MGAALSHPPPPLVEIGSQRNKLLVPAGTSFTVQPPIDLRFPRSSRRRSSNRTHHVPVYQRVSSPYSDDFRPRGRPRVRGRPRAVPPSEDTDSQMSFVDMSPPHQPRNRGFPPRGKGGFGPGGIPMGGGRRPRPGSGPRMGLGAYFDPTDPRARSAPDLHMGMYSWPGEPPVRSHGRGMSPVYNGGMSPGGAAYPSGMGAPGGMGAGNTYAYPQGRVGTPLQMPPQPRASLRPSGLNEVPMGAYTAGTLATPVRPNADPPTAKRLNRVQPSNKKVGPSGQEWIEGDPFLDACTCTTNCTCRKGQRVLYRAQAQDRDGHNGYGEIRYILKDDLGRDCGDHSGCKHRHEEEEKKSSKRKGKSGIKEHSPASKSDIQRINEGMDALHEKLEGLGLNRTEELGRPARAPFGGMPPFGAHGGVMDAMGPHMPPGMSSVPYGMTDPGRMPGGMRGPGGRPGRMPRMRMDGPMPGAMGYDVPFSDSGFGIEDMDDLMPMGPRPRRMMGGRHSMPPDLMPPRRPRGRGIQRNPPGSGMDMDMDMGGFGHGPPMGGRGVGGRRPRFGGRRRRPEFGDEEMDMELGMRRGVGRGAGREEYGGMRDNDEDAAWEAENDSDEGAGMRQSPSRRDEKPGVARHMSGRGAAASRQPRVDEDDDDDDI